MKKSAIFKNTNGLKNCQIYLQARPDGMPCQSDFGIRQVAIPEPVDGEILVRIEYLSVDPYMRGLLKGGIYNSIKPIGIGDLLYGGAVGTVVKSQSKMIQEGDIVEGYLGWQEWAVASAESVRRVDPTVAPISTALGVLGMPGMTAYFGMLEAAMPKSGETLVVSAAAGAVGSVAAQMGRILGCHVVGIAGSEAKVAYMLEDMRLHAAINYKTVPDLQSAISNACPKRIDIYFDNVGGNTFNATTNWMNYGFRYIVCGQIAEYNDSLIDNGPRNLKNFEVYRARLQGFGVREYRHRYDEGIAKISQWIKSGELVYREDIVDGLEKAPEAFIGMLEGRNNGKQLVRVADSYAG